MSALAALGCALWALACFAPSIGFDFVNWDDPLHLLENPLVLEPEAHGFSQHLLTPLLGYPSPVTVLSYRFEVALFGLNSAAPFHATNVALHAIIVSLVFAIGRRLGLGIVASALSALVFGLHPVVAEPVSWVTGRKDLLAALFALLVLWLGMKRRFDWRRVYSWGALLLFALSLFSKPVSAYLVLVLPLWAWLGVRPARCSRSLQQADTGRPELKELVLEALPFALLVFLVFPLAWIGQAKTHSISTDSTLLAVVRNAWFTLGFHLELLLGLTPTSCKHLVTPWPPSFTPSVDLLPVMVAVPVTWLTLRLNGAARQRSLAALGFALLSYLPNSNLIPLTRAIADVYVFMPLAGLAWWLAAVGEPVLQRLRPRMLQAGVVVLVGSFASVQTLRASSHFKNGVTLWQNAYQAYPHDARLCRNLGNARFEVQGPRAALLQYTSCAERFGSAGFLKNIGLAQVALGDHRAARRSLSRALQRDPSDPVARKYLKQIEKR